MGYDFKGVGNGLDVKVTWPESDLEMMQLTVPEYVNSTPFHIYYMTVSGHLEYNFGGNFISKKNRDLVADQPYSDHVKAYLACQIELDLALENLIAQLDASGQLDNTVIALSADHYPYGLTPEEFNELAGHDLEKTFEMYENAFILWSSAMEAPVVVDKYCSSLDIAPTLSNLFGLEYDSRLYAGTDIMSTASPIVCFQDRSFITDKIMFDANSQEVYKLTDEEITEEYIKASIKTVSDKFKYSALTIDEDYYRYLFPE
jgi:phosphoglycerol transferase MdoB-like AlkP superfamily enzyme